MSSTFLEFEKPIAEIEAKLEELQYITDESDEGLSLEVTRLKSKSQAITKNIYNSLSDWQIAQIARHPMRPYSLDYIELLFTDFSELHGDRMYADDFAIIGGVGRFEGRSIMFIGHQKGRDTKERVRRNYGMPKPEGYRKAQRLMRLAEKFNLPVITFIDTPGAYPGLGAEERGQSEAIASSLFKMSKLTVPIISIVIGEGGSGGALAIGVADKLLMLQYSIYSVISPEGCASILWKNAELAEKAAEAMQITAKSLKEYGLIDLVLQEPLGGAHRSVEEMADSIRSSMLKSLDELLAIDKNTLVSNRQARIADYGEYKKN
ncbi:acetyl-CoA carboxylase carboxyltransferase subunit alpha [Woeseiaceae bacterium]|nr:acetyl-CoA carboxylase carboxyltransferase subunit alpha [Woeseiaceae bacterium]MDB2543715.1 acetyl-CoA carboxylase carboxyltransferase subunit alpha [Woeseiaceae bacterium]